MKNVMFLSIIFTLFLIIACGNNSDTQKTTETISPTVKTVAEKIVEPNKEITKKETTAIESKPKKTMETTKMPTKSIDKKSPVKIDEKKNKSSKQPTEETKKESIKPTSTVEKPADKPKEVTKPEPKVETSKEEIPQKATPNHGTFNTLLQKNVSASGKVNYKGFKSQKAELQGYLDDLAANPPSDDWGRKEKMAYWINAYNAFTIKLIIDNYPLSSITNLDGGKPWDKKWIKLGDKTYSLNNIENDILRPKYKDARIHFAVNCAAQSCPPILNKAWTADNLNSNFEKQAKAFINNLKFNKISANSVEISKIFEWYAGDFGNIIDYLNKYATTKINADAKVSYMEYDWALNE